MQTVPALTLGRMDRAWAAIAERFTAYELVVPGSATFICQAQACAAHCCKVFSVALGDREVTRMTAASGRQPLAFLELEGGEPITLPLLQPYLLARKDGSCVLLGADLLCGEYEGRPDACRLYPHFVLFVDETTGRPVHGDPDRMAQAVAAALDGSEAMPLVPLLLRHLECPGFTGPPLAEPAWRGLLGETYRLQYRPGAL
jgi:Fe-S-cluster containining protein